MEELERSDRVLRGYEKGDALVIEMPDGERRRFTLDTEQERQQLCDVLDMLSEEWKSKAQDAALARIDDGDVLPAPIALPNGQAIFVFRAREKS